MAERGLVASIDDPVLATALSEMEASGVALDGPAVDPSPSVPEPESAPVADAPTEASPAASKAEPTADASAPSPAKSAEAVADKTPVPPVDPATPAADPLAGTTPYSYTGRDGQSYQMGMIHVPPEGGAFILPHELPAFQDALAEAQAAITANREFQQFVGQVHGLAHQSGEGDAKQEYRGVEAFKALKADYSANEAASLRLLSGYADREFVYNLAYAYQQGDDKTAAHLLKQMATDAQKDGRLAQYQAEKQFGGFQQAPVQDEGTVADRAFEGAITQLATWARKEGAVLSDADLAEARGYYAPFKKAMVREATPAEVQQNPALRGQKVFDTPSMHPWFQQRIAAAQQAKQDAAARATADAVKKRADEFNKGTDKGRQPQKGATAPTKAPVPVATGEKVSRSAKWSAPLDDFLTEAGIK